METLIKCADCRKIVGCKSYTRSICDVNCTSSEDCEILATCKTSELEICPSCLSKRKQPDAVGFFSGIVKRFLAG